MKSVSALIVLGSIVFGTLVAFIRPAAEAFFISLEHWAAHHPDRMKLILIWVVAGLLSYVLAAILGEFWKTTRVRYVVRCALIFIAGPIGLVLRLKKYSEALPRYTAR